MIRKMSKIKSSPLLFPKDLVVHIYRHTYIDIYMYTYMYTSIHIYANIFHSSASANQFSFLGNWIS